MTDRTILYPHVSNMIWDKRIFEFKKENVAHLKESILERGLIQPIVVAPPPEDADGPFKLTIGRHRYQAIKELYKEQPGIVLNFCGAPIPNGTIPAVSVLNLDPEFLLSIEVHENVHRMDLSWQEKVEALAQIHKVEEARFEKAKELGTIPATAKYSVSATAKKLAGATHGSVEAIANKIGQALVLADHLAQPSTGNDVRKAESARAAFNTIRQNLQAEARRLNVDYEGDTPHRLIEGDCKLIMEQMLIPDESVELIRPKLILADPPYGIGADTYDNMKEHRYDDSWDNAQKTYRAIAQFGFQMCADSANVLLFCTPERWHDVRDIAEGAGWYSWPRPIIWIKSNEGMRPWGQRGLAYTYEAIYWGTKNKKGLIGTHNDVFQFYKPLGAEREHAAGKPVALYQKLIELTCLPGDWILDPCVGSGTTFKAAYLQKCRVIGIENNEETARTARKNLYWTGAPDTTPKVEPTDKSVADL